MIEENVLILDTETKTFNNKIDGKVDIHRLTGMFSYPQNKLIIKTSIADVQKEIDSHKSFVGFNIIDYDKPVLINAGINLDWKPLIDVMVIAKKRLKTLMRIDPINYSLRGLAKELGLKSLKGDIDYNIFQKRPPEWTEQEKAEIIKYTRGDIETTKEMFELFYNQFIVFKQFVSEKNQKNWSWLTCSTGSLIYKMLCNFADLKEKYNRDAVTKKGIGAFVLEPTGEEYTDVWYEDFASLYPQIFMMFNLFGNPTLRPDCTDWFTGNDVFEIEGKYAKDKPHIISLKYEYMFKERKKIKKTDKKLSDCYKTILAGGYGVMRSPMFDSTYYEHTGADCCRIGQVMNKLIGKFFAEAGFKSVAGDTDSRFLKYQGDLSIAEQKKLLDETTKKLIDYVNANVPFPSSTFDLESETGDKPIKFIRFAKDKKSGKCLKKNYLYIYEDEKTGEDRLVIKGLPIIKSSATKLGKRLLKEYIKPKILSDCRCNFFKKELLTEAKKLLTFDIELASVMFKVKPYKSYKSKSCIQASISKKFFDEGAGNINLIKNKFSGEIKISGGYYCSLDHAQTLSMESIMFDKLENEIEPFITQGLSKQKMFGDYK